MFLIEDTIIAAKDSEFFPTSQNAFPDARLIRFANQELLSKIAPLILSVREEYFARTKTITMTSSLGRYVMPERALGGAFKNLFYLSDVTKPLNRVPIPKINPHDVNSGLVTRRSPYAFFIEGDEIILDPTPTSVNASERLQWAYHSRPNRLVATTSCAKITAVAGGVFTVNTDLTGSLSVGSKVDFLSAKTPFLLWAEDVVITAITATTITVAAADVQNDVGTVEPIVNDYICPAGFANIAMIPLEAHILLSELMTYRAMKALGALKNVQEIKVHIQDLVSNILKMLSNRVENEVDVIYDRDSILESSMGRWFGGGF